MKTIVFDFDGTIADSYEEILRIVTEETKEVGFEDIRRYGTKGLMKKSKIPFWRIPRLVKKVTLAQKKNDNIKLFPEMLVLFKGLSKKHVLGILSSNTEENIRTTLKRYDVDSLFDFVYSDSSIFGKHRTLKRMCKKQNLDPADVLYIGDEDRDIVAAKKLSIKVIGVTWGFNDKNRLSAENPDYLVNEPGEILKIIESA